MPRSFSSISYGPVVALSIGVAIGLLLTPIGFLIYVNVVIIGYFFAGINPWLMVFGIFFCVVAILFGGTIFQLRRKKS